MLERRSVLAGLAALPAAGLPIALQAPPMASAAEPIVAMQREATACLTLLHFGADDGSDGDATFDRLASLRERAFDLRATTLPGALASLEWARAEFASYYIDPQAEDDDPDWLDRFTLNMLDGAIAVLRQAAGGVTA